MDPTETNPQQPPNQAAGQATPPTESALPAPLVPAAPASPALAVVGIGASAGGLNALQTFFAALPADTGMTFVVITHLAPAYESALAELLQRQTEMPVTQVTERVAMAPNHVYVIPPDQQLAVSDGHLTVAPFAEPRGQRAPIDHFFRTLAHQYGEGAALIFSGTGTDGSLGIKAIKEGGGLILVQEPQEAEYDGMPRSAIATGLVDLVAPVPVLAQALVTYQQNKAAVQLTTQPEALAGDGEEQLRHILAQLHVRTGHDFSQYKRPTVLRRIGRRLQVTNTADLPQYLELLRHNPSEGERLFQDLLIGVTSFLRDADAFRSLEAQVLPQLFDGKRRDEIVRVWSVGCATGEEAYSLAFLLLEQTATLPTAPAVQVFATDLDEHALQQARQGVYPAVIAADLSEERLQRFFRPENEHYRVTAEVRERVLFAPHNLLKDPPFSKLDLISCRNLLIYLQRELQEQVFELFHYALRPGGYLFLGTAETAEGVPALFQAVDRKQRLYRRRERNEGLPHLPALPLRQRPLWQPTSSTEAPALTKPAAALHHGMLEEYAPPSLLVDETFTVLHFSATVGRYLLHQEGTPTSDVTRLVRPELQFGVQAALEQAFAQGKAVVTRPQRVQFNGTAGLVYLSVRPRPSSAGKRMALVLFLEDERIAEGAGRPGSEEVMSTEEVPQVAEQLRQARTQLQAMRAEHARSTEELTASNEELQSINEEYKSTLEELETSKEELQSMNEELQTINQELKHKVEEVSQAHNDIQNLLTSMEIATLFLDRKLSIQRYTTRLTELFHVLPTDLGRPISHLKAKLAYPTLEADAQRVLQDLAMVEREVQTEAGRSFLVRLRPYRTVEERIEGVVLTFVDLTERKQLEEQVQLAREYAESIVDTLREPLLVLEPSLHIRSANQSFYRLFGVRPAETEGQLIYELGNNQWAIPALRTLLEDVLPANHSFNDFAVEHEFEQLGQRTMLLNARRLDSVQLILLAIEDVTERQQTRQLAALNAELVARNQELDLFTQLAAHDLREPLRGIKQLATWLRQDNTALLPAPAQKHLSLLHERTERLEMLLDDLLAYARAGRERYPPEQVDVAALVQAIVAQLTPPQGFSVTLTEPLPTLIAERVPLAVVLRNLIGNAIQHHQQPQAGTVQVSAQVQESVVAFTVADNGPGIAAHFHEHLFDPFPTPKPPRAHAEGGAGLPLIKRIVESHGGAIQIASNVGQGTTIHFTWPKVPRP